MSQSDTVLLASLFLVEVKQFGMKNNKVDAPNRYKQLVLREAERLMKTGADAKTVAKLLRAYGNDHDNPADAYSIQEVLDFYEYTYDYHEVVEDPDNLVVAGRFYYHPWLQISPPPPKVRINEDGTFEDIAEPFYLEIVDRVTPTDLVQRFYDVMEVDERFQEPKKHEGAFRSMVGQYGLDLIMYMMGETQAQCIDQGERLPVDPWQIRQYAGEAMERLEEKKNIAYMEGVHYVQPKKQ